MYTRGGKSTVEKPPLVNKPKIYKGRQGEVREARGGKSTKPSTVCFDIKYSEFNFVLSFIATLPKEDKRTRRRILERRQEFMTFPLIVLGVCLYQHFLYRKLAKNQDLSDEELNPSSR